MSESHDHTLLSLAQQVLDECRALGVKLVTAESCTGGLIAATLTEIPGASDIFECGFVTYSNQAKIDLLGVSPETIDAHGAVSEQTARAMAEGALARARATISVSATGIAGPTGGTPERPVGLVHFASARKGQPTVHKKRLFGTKPRAEIRQFAVQEALELIRDQIGKSELA